MIRASLPRFLPRFGLAALLCAVAPGALAQAQQQPQQQRSRTEPQATQPARGTTSGTKPEAGSGTSKPGAAAKPGTSAKPGAASKPGAGKPDAAKAGGAGQAKPGSSAPAPGGGQATLLASFGDWGAYATGQGRAKLCYALSQPKDRQPKDLKREPGYLFVSFRPADNVRNEIAVVMGFPAKDGGPAEAAIGTATYALVTKGANAWVRNPTEEAQVIGTMSKGKDLTIKATSGRGQAASDRYSLTGFAQALDRARKECS